MSSKDDAVLSKIIPKDYVKIELIISPSFIAERRILEIL
jgi:hypothetical protein